MRPALTPEEWAAVEIGFGKILTVDGGGVEVVPDDAPGSKMTLLLRGGGDCDIYGDERHRLAALALHGQPFGFSRADVACIRGWAGDASRQGEAQLNAIADRIEALLPPEGP